ncbi:MAG: two-component system OmpR family sensor kinase [Myxococcota bacterium]|jgi:two-component system OmpR family sensor kinase
MSRLFVQVYAGFVGVIVLCVLVSGLLALLLFDRPAEVNGLVEVSIAALPDPSEPTFDAAFADLGRAVDAELELWDADGRSLGRTGPALPYGPPGWFHGRAEAGPRVGLSDGRTVAVAFPHRADRRWRFALWLCVIALAIGVGCWPLVRRLGGRLERLTAGVGAWGDDLGARVPVEGKDEIAAVATAFNASADRVQRLVEGQRRTLASVSHELRSPLARIRMALELLDDGSESELVADAVRDVEELDLTVGDLLQVGRLHGGVPVAHEDVDLRALADAAAERFGAAVSGAGTWSGDPRLLRRLLRNLLENAARHGAPPIEVTVSPTELAVADRGPGIPEVERDRVFEPFHRPSGHAEGRDGGVGLGLFLVREIAAAHGATVRVEARDGGGTVVRVSR